MKLLEMMGLVGIGYIMKDHGAFYPRRRSYSYQENKLKRLLTDKITGGIERLLYGMSAESYKVRDISFDTWDDALLVQNRLAHDIDQYGQVTVSDYYGYAGFPGFSTYTDSKYGWDRQIDTKPILKSKGKWKLKLPRPKLLKYIATISEKPPINYSRYFTNQCKQDSESDCDFDNEITRDEYLNTHKEYLKTEITIYRNFVIASNNGPLDDRPENLIGEKNYKRICENMAAYDWGTYYIRNDEERTDIELNVCDENYEDSLNSKDSEIETIEREEDNLF